MNRLPSCKVQHNWIWYCLVVVIAVIWWAMAFRVYHVPDDSQKVAVFAACEVKSYALEDKLEQDCALRLLELHSSTTDSADFQTKYSVVGLNNCHLLIVPAYVAEQTACVECFLPIDELGFTTTGAFEQEGIAYGFALNRELLTPYLNIDEAYYLFVGGKAADGDGQVYENTRKVIQALIQHNE